MKIGSREYKEWLDSPLTKALKSSFEQSVTDPENQPSQYGTVTLAMYELVCKQRDLAVEALKETTKALEHRWEVVANRAAPVMESVIDAAHTKGISALSTIKESEK